MPEKIGKYEILGRIGRGGMGTIFRARDPVLDRAVALKMISADVEVTEELRSRFFREAQACARLTHPNIVTVYDMGEDDGRLFIVMELLEGQELRRVIADRTPMALEDKISVMAQVCDGLHYAHQMGVVHRDVKPGNILLLRNGQVKILDFGIARIVATEAGLTRTGLIMGTLRYISPEQVRGRADHRSDIFSAGAVFYELLSFRPPFTGEDPMQLLDQLRTEIPLPLGELDPTIPPELNAIVERAMQKDPALRFADFNEMRSQLDEIQRKLGEEAQIVRGRLRERHARLRDLQATLRDRLGSSAGEEAAPTLDERGRLSTLRALERDLAERIQRSEAMIGRAEVLAPAFARGSELLRAGRLVDAASEFEAIVADMPEHGPAREGLAEARAQAEGERRRQLAIRLMGDARAAFDEGGYTRCLEILGEAAGVPPPVGLTTEIRSLREAAEAKLAERRRAEDARDRAGEVRDAARASDAERHAPAVWGDAAGAWQRGEEFLGRGEWERAAEAFGRALGFYRAAEAEVAEVSRREREQVQAVRRTLSALRDRVASIDAEARVFTEWAEADTSTAAGDASLARGEYGEARRAFERAQVLYGRAEERAREAIQVAERARAEAEKSREASALARRAASEGQAAKHAAESWGAGENTWRQALAALEGRKYEAARALFDYARRHYAAAAQSAAVAAEAEGRRADAMVNEARRSFDGGDAAACLRRVGEVLALRPGHAGAEALRRQALERLRHPGAGGTGPGVDAEFPTVLDQPTVLVSPTGLAAPTVVDTPTVLAAPAAIPTPSGVSGARTEMGDVTVWAPEGGSPTQFRGQRSEAAAGDRELDTNGRGRTRAVVVGLAGLAILALVGVSYWLAVPPEPTMVPAPPAGREEAEETRRRMVAERDGAARADAERLAPAEFSVAAEKARAAEAALERQDIVAARQGYLDAGDAFGRARVAAERVAAQRQAAGAAESRAGEARRAAASAGAATLASALWAKAGATQRDAEAARGQGAFDRAAALFGEAEHTYREAQNAAGTARARVQQDEDKRREFEAEARVREQATLKAEAEQARGVAVSSRQAAEQVGAPRYAPKLFASAQGREGEASTALDRSNYAGATKGFGEARSGYDAAAQEAKREKGALIAALDVAHRDALDRRGDAVKAQAEAFAKDSFESARKKEAEADEQVKREDLPLAAQTYRDAAKSYAVARDAAQEAFAKARADADRVRNDMLREKAGAASGSPDHDKAVEQERKGNESYDRRDVRAATGQFKSAGELYAKAKIPAPKPAPPPVPDEGAKIKAALEEFKVALESRDLARLQRVWTGMTGPELSRHRETFENISRYTFEFSVRTNLINGDVARVRLFRKDTLTAKNGTLYHNETEATFTLRRSQDRWTVDRIQ